MLKTREFFPGPLRRALARLVLTQTEPLTRGRTRVTLTGVLSAEELAALRRVVHVPFPDPDPDLVRER